MSQHKQPNRSVGTVSTGRDPAAGSLSPRGYRFGAVVPFALLHLAALSVLFVPFSLSMLGWFAGSYLLRMFGVTAGYHRYFDLTYLALRALGLLGIARDFRSFRAERETGPA